MDNQQLINKLEQLYNSFEKQKGTDLTFQKTQVKDMLDILGENVQKESAQTVYLNYKRLFDDFADATLIIENNKFIDCNKATLDLLRMKSKEDVFNTHPSVLSPEFQPDNIRSQEKADEMMRIAFNKGSHRFEWVHKKADDELFHAEVLLTKMHRHGKDVLHCVWRDITDKKLAESDLKASEENYKQLFEEAVDGILIGNNKGIVIQANNSISKLSGYNIDEIVGYNIKKLFPDGEMERTPLRYDLILAGKSVLKERQIKRKDGSLVSIEMNTKMIADNKLQAYIRDVSERKEHEQKIIDQNIELEKAKNELKQKNESLKMLNSILKEQKKELNMAKERAEESDRLKTAFLANMSHEIRTPMNGILGFAQLLQEKKITQEKREQFLNLINQSGEQLLGIINDLIDISKIEAGQMELNKTKVDIAKVLNDQFTFFKIDADLKDVKISISSNFNSCSYEIITDEQKLKQVLTNLIKNAIKFTEPQGYVKIYCELNETQIKISVADSGIGIPIEFKDKIFGRFQQATGNSIVRSHSGSGLGLAISKAFVEMLGGKIWFESQKNKGTIFSFTLPKIDKAEN